MTRRTLLPGLVSLAGLAVLFTSPALGAVDKGLALRSSRLYDKQAAEEAKKGNAAEAKALWQKLVAIGEQGLSADPEEPELNKLVGKAYCKLDKPKEAGEKFAAGLAGVAKGRGGKSQANALEGERFNCWVEYRNQGVQWFNEAQKLMNGAQAAADSQKATESFAKGLTAFGHALEVDPNKTEVYPPMAFSYIFTGRKDEGREVLIKALANSPGDTTLVRNLSAVDIDIAQAIGTKDFDRSIVLLAEADSLDPSATTVFQIATLYANRAGKAEGKAQAADYDLAIGYYVKVLKRYPEGHFKTVGGTELSPEDQLYRDALFNMTVAYYTLKRYGDLERAVEQLLYIEPRNADLYNMHAAAQQAQKKDKRMTQDLWVVSAFRKGKKADDPAARAAKATADMAAAKTAHGVPAEVYVYTDEQTKATIETWFYWKDGVAITFVSGKKLNESPIPKLQS